MRAIVTLSDQKLARQFSSYLRSQSIENTCEITLNKATHQIECTLWVHEEDKVAEAMQAWEEFQKDPESENFQAPAFEKPFVSAIKNPKIILEEPKKNNPTIWVTPFFLALCIFLFAWNSLGNFNKKDPVETKQVLLAFTPVEKALLIDFPRALAHFESKPIDFTHPQALQKEVEKMKELPYFHGVYPELVNLFASHKEKVGRGPILERVQKGEIWRLFTPSLMHRDILHLLFNILWLWFLGKQIENRILPLRFFIFILISAAFSNLAQYFMSGPLFLGFSGVITSMAGFIWVRKKIAPWEGYPLNTTTLLFIAFFILATLALQVASFFFQAFSSFSFHLQIANTGHIVGALVGMFLARLPFFSWRVS